MNPRPGWRIWIDVGGTFTDALGIGPDGSMRRAKILSTGALRGTVESHEGPARLRVRQSWGVPDDFPRGFRFRVLGRKESGLLVSRFDPEESTLELNGRPGRKIEPGTSFEIRSSEEAPVLAARILTGTPPGRPLPAPGMRLATTLATNALLERRGVPTALFITEGFGDLLAIGTQQRPELFTLEINLPEGLYSAVVEVPERLGADGKIVRPLDIERVTAEIGPLRDRGIKSAAVVLLHSYRNPCHELEIESLLRRAGFRHVSRSSDIAPLIGFLPRAETTVVNATLEPVVRDYLDRIAADLSGGRLRVMTSAGGLVGPRSIRSKDMLLSGPAGGVVGAALAGRRSGYNRVIVFDMGGTSTDVARFDSDYEYRFEHRVGDAHLVAPAMAIETVAAGGGSICWFDGERLRVGPRSAGADPGPACYDGGGPLTLTDVNLLLGRLDPLWFEIPINPGRAAARLEELHDSIIGQPRRGMRGSGALLAGLLEIADERMADAIRRVSLRRGYDPADCALVAFGGAGGQHACGVAARLGIHTIVLPPDGGLLSAFGLGHAVVERFVEKQVLEPLESAQPSLKKRFADLSLRASRKLQDEGIPAAHVVIRRRIALLRFVGQDSVVEVPYREGRSLAATFRKRYAALYGHRPEGRPVEVESLRVVASSRPAATPRRAARAGRARPPRPTWRRCHIGGRLRKVPVFRRDDLRPGARFRGPALVFERHSTAVIEAGWSAGVDGAGALVLRRGRGAVKRASRRPPAGRTGRGQPVAVRLELFTNRLRSIAIEMGERLQRTAISTNVRERLDFSCAILDAAGDLIVNAPHIPVHLGSLGLCVRRVRDAITIGPGDTIVTNHPDYGGSHLPDVTVITPVFETVSRSGGSARRRTPPLLAYVASRAHHAEIGGSRPGSFPPAARHLAEEGVVIPPVYLVRNGRPRWDTMRRLLEAGRYPSRAVQDNLADLRAALAANHAGAEGLRSHAAALGRRPFHGLMASLVGLAERRMRRALSSVPDGTYHAEELLDDGSPLRVAITIKRDRAHLDFSGSAPVHPGNLNATPAVVRSVVMYVLRLLLRDPLPLNDGLMRPVTITIPPGILNPGFGEDPAQAPAVVGGNVETSQRLVDTLLKALGLAACSQGTMNNLLFGTDRFGYYETIGGGCGAGPGFDGAAATHSHMTNTRITDPEVIEHRYPVRVERFAVRRGSGGEGRFRGGDGAVREITFLQPVEVSILSQHRVVPPYGLAGGADGSPGSQRLVRATGEVFDLGPIAACDAKPGDRLVVETPGGGGYGPPRRRS